MNWFVLTLVSSVTGAVSSILQRVLMKDDKSEPYLYSVVFQFTVALLVFIFAVIRGFQVPDVSNHIGNLILMVVLYTLANVMIFNAFKVADAGEVRVSVGSRPLWILLGSFLFLGESISWMNLVGTLLIVGAIVVLYFRKSTLKLTRGAMFGLFAGIFFGLAFVNDIVLVKEWDVPSLMAVEFAITPLFMALIQPNRLRSIGSLQGEDIQNVVAWTVLWNKRHHNILGVRERWSGINHWTDTTNIWNNDRNSRRTDSQRED